MAAVRTQEPQAEADPRAQLPGLLRTAWVRVTHYPGAVTCEVFGLGSRRRQVRAVSLATATRLASRGVPMVVRRKSEEA